MNNNLQLINLAYLLICIIGFCFQIVLVVQYHPYLYQMHAVFLTYSQSRDGPFRTTKTKPKTAVFTLKTTVNKNLGTITTLNYTTDIKKPSYT